MIILLKLSRFVGTLLIPLLGGIYLGCCTSCTGSSLEMSSSILVGDSSASSSLSMIIVLPFSFIVDLPACKCRGDHQIDSGSGGFFLVFDVCGDLECLAPYGDAGCGLSAVGL